EGETRQGHQSAHGHRTAPVILATASFAARGTTHRTPPCADIAAISFDCGGTPSVDNMIVNSRPSTADAYGAGSCATTRPLPTMRSGPLQPCSASRTSDADMPIKSGTTGPASARSSSACVAASDASRGVVIATVMSAVGAVDGTIPRCSAVAFAMSWNNGAATCDA